MLYTIAVVLIILWLLGLVTSYTIGGFIHILLVVAVGVFHIRTANYRPFFPFGVSGAITGASPVCRRSCPAVRRTRCARRARRP